MSKGNSKNKDCKPTIKSNREFQLIRENYAISIRGKGNGMYGKKHTQEAKDKVSKANKGRKWSASERAKNAKWHEENDAGFKGKHHTPEFCKRLSESRRGQNNPMYGKKNSPEHLAKRIASLKNQIPWSRRLLIAGIYINAKSVKEILGLNKYKLLNEYLISKYELDESRFTVDQIKELKTHECEPYKEKELKPSKSIQVIIDGLLYKSKREAARELKMDGRRIDKIIKEQIGLEHPNLLKA
jgi:hypothetical protein